MRLRCDVTRDLAILRSAIQLGRSESGVRLLKLQRQTRDVLSLRAQDALQLRQLASLRSECRIRATELLFGRLVSHVCSMLHPGKAPGSPVKGPRNVGRSGTCDERGACARGGKHR